MCNERSLTSFMLVFNADSLLIKSYSIGFADGDEPGVSYEIELQGDYYTNMGFKVR